MSTVEDLFIHSIWIEPIDGPRREDSNRRRRTNNEGKSIHGPLQQINKAQLSIVELYQVNRELRQQLATKTLEASMPQSREGNET
jgi:hypothetical protein